MILSTVENKTLVLFELLFKMLEKNSCPALFIALLLVGKIAFVDVTMDLKLGFKKLYWAYQR